MTPPSILETPSMSNGIKRERRRRTGLITIGANNEHLDH